ncbi:hypothetical protein FRC18_007240 [Serendipita sp. 400]|nr:hypothetical protein FRC18_007240 [Serendipita sp. 400]
MSHNVPGFQSGNLDRRMPVRNKVETNKELSELGNSHDRNPSIICGQGCHKLKSNFENLRIHTPERLPLTLVPIKQGAAELVKLSNFVNQVISNTSSEAPANDKFVFATKMLPLFADE